MEYEEIKEVTEDFCEFEVGDCVHVLAYVGLVTETRFDCHLGEWQYKVSWNDGDTTIEDNDSGIISSKEWVPKYTKNWKKEA